MSGRAASWVCLAAAALLLVTPGALGAGDFIEVSNAGVGFSTASCPNFVFSGYNTWQPIEAAAGLIGSGSDVGPQFDLAVKYDLTVVRMFGFSVQLGINNQFAPGTATAAPVYNESMLVAFDQVIAAADQRNLKLIVALANNWDYNGNMSDCKCWYTNTSATATGCDDFFTDANAINAYLANAKAIMNRVNTVTKLAYNNDPTIMSWDLINEGRCEANCTAADIQAWTAKVAPIVKSYAPKQLVTIGQDGFWQESNCASNTGNPVPNSDGWPLRTGQDFLTNHAVDGIDYTSIHMWPDNWARTDLDFGKNWINAHLTQARILGKPLVLEEFGKGAGGTGDAAGQTAEQQQGYYELAYALAEGSINEGDALRGIAFWRWDSVDPAAQLTGFDQEATITTSSDVFQNAILPRSKRFAQVCPSNSGSAATASAGRRLRQAAVPQSQTTNTTAPIAATASQGMTNAAVTGAACAVNLTVPGQATSN